jgi:hypothetical protein
MRKRIGWRGGGESEAGWGFGKPSDVAIQTHQDWIPASLERSRATWSARSIER